MTKDQDSKCSYDAASYSSLFALTVAKIYFFIVPSASPIDINDDKLVRYVP